ncbi:hypothetical protein JCM10296v2_003488 [Rhodotorula toruloides]
MQTFESNKVMMVGTTIPLLRGKGWSMATIHLFHCSLLSPSVFKWCSHVQNLEGLRDGTITTLPASPTFRPLPTIAIEELTKTLSDALGTDEGQHCLDSARFYLKRLEVGQAERNELAHRILAPPAAGSYLVETLRDQGVKEEDVPSRVKEAAAFFKAYSHFRKEASATLTRLREKKTKEEEKRKNDPHAKKET